VISAATIEARNSGWDVIGIRDGFEHLISGHLDGNAEPLEITGVSRIHPFGGTILGTSRANPTKSDEALRACLASLRKLGVDALLTIGGDDTAFSASRLAEESGGSLRVVHVPKTIDNDLPLPGGMPTFGFQTARHVGAQLVGNLMTDAIATKRWFFVVAMGRSAGHLALGIGKAAGATITLIAEEFPEDEPIALRTVVDILECSVFKRRAHGRPFGVALIAEGIGERLAPGELLEAAPDIERDEHGHIRLDELNLHRILAKMVADRFRERGERITITAKNIGYELRGAPPIPFDIDYTRDLGWGAVDHLRDLLESGSEEHGSMITLHEGHLVPLPFDAFTDPATGRVRTRGVDLSATSYRVAREYMIRLEPDDLEDAEKVKLIAAAAQMSAEDFRARYGYLAVASAAAGA
jgi:6-phosphofructokinase 1